MKRILIILMALAMIPCAYAATETASQITVSLVNQDPDPATAGNMVDIRLGIENLGGKAASNLVIELAPEYPFELVPGDNPIHKINSINAYQTAQNMIIEKYKVIVNKDARAGTYDLKVNYYTEGSNVVEHKTVSVAIGTKESAEIIHIDKTLLVPGKETPMRFTINNVGNAPLRDLKFSWENADKIILPVGSDNTRYIKYIDVDDSAEIEYKVIADTNAVLGLYQLDLSLTYTESVTSTEKTITTIAGVYVGGGTDFDVAFAESTGTETSFTIANVGSNPANSVSVIIPEQRGWTVTGSNSFMIGNLNKGDYTVASFSLQSPMRQTWNMTQGNTNLENRRQTYSNTTRFTGAAANTSQDTLTIEIVYTDTMGERHTVEKKIKAGSQGTQNSISSTGAQMTFQRSQRATQSSFFSLYGSYIAVIAILTIAYFIRREYKKNKMMNPSYTYKDLIRKKKK